MVNIRSKFVKAIGVVLSTGCMISNCAYIKATPKFSVDDVEPQFEKFLRDMDNSKVDKENALLNCHSSEADSWRSIVVKDITNLANYVYYAQMALEAENDVATGIKLKAKVYDLADQIDKVNKYELSKEVYYGSKNLEVLKPHIEKFMEYVDSLDADDWGEYIAVVDDADKFLENLIFRLENIRNSGGVGQLFKSGSALHSGNWNKYNNLWKLNRPGKYHMVVGDVYKSNIIQMFTVQQNDFDNKMNEHNKICKPCSPPECLVNSNYQQETDAINKVFNLLLNKMYNDYFSLCQSVYGKGEHNYSIGHHLVPALDNEKSQFSSYEYEEKETDKYNHPFPKDVRFKKVGFNFHSDEKV